MKVAYCRASSVSQKLDVQRDAVTAWGAEKIFEEKASGTSTKNRTQLKECLEFVREGDELVVQRLDRLARSVLDLQLILKQLDEKGVTLHCTEQPVDTKSAMGKMFIDFDYLPNHCLITSFLFIFIKTKYFDRYSIQYFTV